jgi:hypothetical protein
MKTGLATGETGWPDAGAPERLVAFRNPGRRCVSDRWVAPCAHRVIGTLDKVPVTVACVSADNPSFALALASVNVISTT